MTVHHQSLGFGQGYRSSFQISHFFYLDENFGKKVVNRYVENLAESWIDNWTEVGLIIMSRKLVGKIRSMLLMTILTQ